MLFSNHCLPLDEKHMDAQIGYCFISQKSLKHISAATTFGKIIYKILQTIVNYEVILHQKNLMC